MAEMVVASMDSGQGMIVINFGEAGEEIETRLDDDSSRLDDIRTIM
jgi:hypothetical protein